jgi:hypothetical protein
MIPENLGYAQEATKLEESDVQQEPMLTSKSSIETTSMAEADAKIGEPLSSHLIVDSNGISNANTVIDSECPTLSAKDAGVDTMEQARDLKENSLSPNSTVDTHDYAIAGADEARNDPCDEVIDSNVEQETVSEPLVIPKGVFLLDRIMRPLLSNPSTLFNQIILQNFMSGQGLL